MSVYLDTSSNFHPYECDGKGKCPHCDRKQTERHDPATCPLCLDDAGVRYRNPHLTRHTFATNWLRSGGRLETLSVILGHASIRTTFDLYGHLDMSDAAIDMRLIEDKA